MPTGIKPSTAFTALTIQSRKSVLTNVFDHHGSSG
jgi:hypothetical protein